MALSIIGAVLVLLAIVMLIHAERVHRAHVRWCATASRAEGVVSRVGRRHWHSRNEPTSDDRLTTVAVVRFRAANGVEYEFDGRDAPKQAGAQVEVAYDPASPSTAHAVARTRRYGCIVMMVIAGLALILAEAVTRTG